MISVKLNEHSAEDVREIENLRAMGVPEDVIQMGYDNTQRAREKSSEQNEEGKECFNKECRYNTSNGICIAFDGCAGAALGDFRE